MGKYPPLPGHKQPGEKFEQLFGLLCLVLLMLAYLSHLGFLPLNFRDDEARRALVTGEMMYSGDYLTPTINGEIYLNKPPLYNWLVAGYWKLSGTHSLFVFRLPVIVATIGLGCTVFFVTRKYVSSRVAFFTAFAYMTNGRILIFDSLVGLIDTSFAWLVYTGFILIYHYGEKKKYYHLFLLSYLVATAGFLMKGLPALVFLALSLLTYFTWKKRFRVLFHPAHFAGMGLFVVLTGWYYQAFLSSNSLALTDVLSRLMAESSKRTAFAFNWVKLLRHLLEFPFLFLYDYAPWTIFLVTLFRKKCWQALRQNDFVFYTLLLFGVNIIVYWTSPQVYARYLFMFLPLVFGICFYLFFSVIESNAWQHRFIRFLLPAATGVILVTLLVLPFTGFRFETAHSAAKALLLAAGMAVLLLLMFKQPRYRYYLFIPVVILFRFAFNWFIVEQRYKKLAQSEAVAVAIADVTAGQELYILRGAAVGNFDAKSFQVMIRREEVLKYADTLKPNAFYIIDEHQAAGIGGEVKMGFRNMYSDSLLLIRY